MTNNFSFVYKNSFKTTRVLDSSFIPDFINVELDFKKSENIEVDNIEELCQVTLIKLEFFIKTVLDGSIFVENTDPICTDFLLSEDGIKLVSNTIVMCPTVPTDVMISVLLLSKFNALTQNIFTFNSIKLGKMMENIISVKYDGNPLNELPTKDEWFSDEGFTFESPWWLRNDISTYDAIFESTTELEDVRKQLSFDNFLPTSEIITNNEPTNVVKPKFTVVKDEK